MTIFRKGVAIRVSASFVIKSLILTLLIFSLSGFQVKTDGSNLCRIYLIDNSGSVFLDAPSILKEIKTDVQLLKPDDSAGIIVFGRDASAEIIPRKGSLVGALPIAPSQIQELRAFSSRINQSGTNIEQGLLVAENLLKNSGSAREVFLFSDGNQTEGDALNAAAELSRNNMAVFSIPIGPSDFNDIKIWCKEPVQEVRQGEPVKIVFTVQSTCDAAAAVNIYRDKEPVREFNNIKLSKNQPFDLAAEFPALTGPVAHYEIQVSAKSFNEFCLQNNYASTIAYSKAKPIIAYIGGGPDSQLAKIIRANNNFELINEDKISPATIPLCDIIIMDDFALNSDDQKELTQSIATAVVDGKGLFIIGGRNSFGLGNYSGSIIEEISPVWATPQESLALAIVIDASGSMAEPSGFPNKDKFRIASNALEQAFSLLNKQDALEVIAFNQGFDAIYPIATGAEKDKLHQALLQIKPNGSTIILPPIRQAIKSLLKTKSAKRHIIVLSDGYSTGGELLGDFQEVGRLLKESGISISTIATGEKIQKEALLALSQDQTNGKFYHIIMGNDINALGKSIKEDLVQKKELYRHENTPLPAQITGPAEMLKGLPPLPPVFGYNRTSIKERGKLAAFVDENNSVGIPLIAEWQYGAGRVMAFASSLDSDWTKDWLNWPQLPQAITQMLRWLTPAHEDLENARITTLLIDSNNLRISIENLLSGKLLYSYELRELLKSNIVSSGELAQTSAHGFEKIIPDLDQGIYYVHIKSNNTPVSTLPVIVTYSPEWLKFGPDYGLLRNTAELTGGTLLNTMKEYHNAGIQPKTYKRIDLILIVASLILFILDLLLKVIFHSPFILQVKK
ncbi:MAG: VWA domain-containing protein [Planctomycetota bacterium]